MIKKKTKRDCNRIHGSKRCLTKKRKGTCPIDNFLTTTGRGEGPSLRFNTLSGVFQKRRIA